MLTIRAGAGLEGGGGAAGPTVSGLGTGAGEGGAFATGEVGEAAVGAGRATGGATGGVGRAIGGAIGGAICGAGDSAGAGVRRMEATTSDAPTTTSSARTDAQNAVRRRRPARAAR